MRPWHYRERFGALTYEQVLAVENATLSFLVERGWLLGVPIPSFLLPRSCAKEFALNDHFHFDVGLYAPLTGELIVRYQGQVHPDAAASCDSPRFGARSLEPSASAIAIGAVFGAAM